MISVINENFYDMALILKIKERTEPKKIKKIVNNLKKIEEDEVNNFSKLKIKVFEEKKEDVKKIESKIFSSIIDFKSHIEDTKLSNSRSILDSDDEYEGENTPSTVRDNEEQNKVDGSVFSADE